MGVIVTLLGCAAALVIGFMLGFITERDENPTVVLPKRTDETNQRLNEEYRNFLSYDGSEQA